MATDRIVEDGDETYYVGVNGARVTDAWVAVENEDGEEIKGTVVENLWYYFGSNGKAVKATTGELQKKTINGAPYFFDSNGYMQHGWVEYGKDTYYCGTENQGWAAKGWQFLETDVEDCPAEGHEDDEVWFYFSSYKMVKADEGKGTKTKYIDGHYYSFDEDGVMLTGWQDGIHIESASGIAATGANAYIASNGVMSSGWVKATKGENTNWYYMVTVRDDANENAYRAVPFNSGSAFYRAKSINGKTYMFDTDGKMLKGLQKLGEAYDKPLAGEGDDAYDGVTYKKMEDGIYFFSEDSGSGEGRMLTGKVSRDNEGETENYYFATDGRALISTYKDGCIYGADGIRWEAKDGNNYEIIRVHEAIATSVKDADGQLVTIPANVPIVVSSTGKVRTSGTIRIDDEKYTVKFDIKGKTFTVTAE